ncbi:hypothetical protein SLNSH_02760 [Alsobacter soli]|uniref:Uncharacterized protein n=1 Tax=Alsobacter soli TaxID=2109933 RepID=A0A2T1HYP9_9HYPH|nr:hypothetical protein [Alsobacter soli]PSC06734.1 hypothetical protein SLNSH_02760 [Alsobacter soli]
MIGGGEPIDSDKTLAAVADVFRKAAAGVDPVANVIIGLRVIVQAAGSNRLALSGPGPREAAAAAIYDAMPMVMKDMADRLTLEDIAPGMGAAAGLLAVFEAGDPWPAAIRQDQLDLAAILAAELEIVARRRGIERRGAPLQRQVQLAQAREAARPDGPLN